MFWDDIEGLGHLLALIFIAGFLAGIAVYAKFGTKRVVEKEGRPLFLMPRGNLMVFVCGTFRIQVEGKEVSEETADTVLFTDGSILSKIDGSFVSKGPGVIRACDVRDEAAMQNVALNSL